MFKNLIYNKINSKKMVILLFLFLFLSLAEGERAKDYFNLGKEAYFKSDFSAAVEYLHKACQIEPTSVEYLYLLAKSYQRQDKLKEAADVLRQTIAIAPTNKEALLLFGEVTFKLKAYEEAEYAYRELLKIEEHPEALFNLGKIYLFTHRLKEAIITLEKASKVNQEDLGEVMFYLGQAYVENRDYNHGYTAFTTAIKVAPHRAIYYYWRGNASFAAGDYRSPQDVLWTSHMDYQKALEYGLYSPEVYFMYGNTLLNRAFYYIATNRSKEAYNLLESAETKYKEVIKLDPSASNAYNNLGLTYYYMNKLEEAEEALKKAIKLEPFVPFFHDNLGDVYYKASRFKEAIREWELTLELNPNYKPADAGLLPIPPKTPQEKIKDAKRRIKLL